MMFCRLTACTVLTGLPMAAKSAAPIVPSRLLHCASSPALSPLRSRSSSFGSPLLCSKACFSIPATPAASVNPTTAITAPKKRGRMRKTTLAEAAPTELTGTEAGCTRDGIRNVTVAPKFALVEPPTPQVAASASEAGVEDMSAAATATPAVPAPKRKRVKRTTKAEAAAATTAGARAMDDKRDSKSDASTHANPLGDSSLDELSFFANMEDSPSRGDSPRSFEESTLVYNSLTGRLTNESAASIESLKEIGFGITRNRQLCVERPEELNKLAARIRAGTATLPERWPKTLVKALGGILTNAAIADPAEAVRQIMQVKVNSVTRSRYASVVSATDDDPARVDASSTFTLLDESTDPMRALELNAEQERVIDIALQGHHMYIGGSAGTGKTVLLRVLSRRLQAHRLRVAMTATTGVAGCHIGGSTFHHALGVSSKGDFLRRSTILDYDVIILDEVSMFPLRLFENFDRVLREEAGTPDLPFGGVQIILCGDFLQLGCINEESVIHSRLFQEIFVKVRLQTLVRQSQYSTFAEGLQLMRRGIVPGNLTATVQQLPPGTMVESAVNLLPTNKEVHAANERELERLSGDPLTLTPEHGITALKCDATATLLLRTKPDFNEHEFAQHIRSLLQATLDLPRASLLSLYRIYEDGHAMRVILPPGESVAWREAMRERFLEVAGLINDLELGATVTEIVPNGDGLHTPENEEYLQKLMAKHPIAQPLTFKKGCRVLLRANLSAALVNGSIGTVVDFVECTEANFPLYLRNDNVNNCIERYRVFCLTECGMPIPMVPVVKFHSGETVAVPPWEFTVGGSPSTNYFSLSTVALPLSLAYAFTVHKVQGLTLVGRVHLELSRMWPCEHLLYVAMSRVRNPEQLSMSSFTPSMVVANDDCVAFDVKLQPAQDITNEELQHYPVSAWKRCNDTIYHLRRRGSSLRRLLQDAALASANNAAAHGAGSNSNAANGTAHVLGSLASVTDAGEDGHLRAAAFSSSSASSALTVGLARNGSPGLTGRPRPASENSGLVGHLTAVEQSVLVARRMRKLVKHVERVAKLADARKRAKVVVEAAAGGRDSVAEHKGAREASDGSDDGAPRATYTTTLVF